MTTWYKSGLTARLALGNAFRPTVNSTPQNGDGIKLRTIGKLSEFRARVRDAVGDLNQETAFYASQ